MCEALASGFTECDNADVSFGEGYESISTITRITTAAGHDCVRQRILAGFSLAGSRSWSSSVRTINGGLDPGRRSQVDHDRLQS